MSNSPNSTFDLLPDEVSEIVFKNMYVIAIFDLQFVCKRFYRIVKERFFVFSLGEAYRKNISLYIEECWGTIYNELANYNDRELATVDGRNVGIRSYDEDFNSDSIPVFRLNTDNPYFINEKIKYLTQLWKKMQHPKILPYVLVRDVADYFSEQLLNYATAERAMGGNTPKINKDNYYVHENLFSFYTCLIDILAHGQEYCHGEVRFG